LLGICENLGENIWYFRQKESWSYYWGKSYIMTFLLSICENLGENIWYFRQKESWSYYWGKSYIMTFLLSICEILGENIWYFRQKESWSYYCGKSIIALLWQKLYDDFLPCQVIWCTDIIMYMSYTRQIWTSFSSTPSQYQNCVHTSDHINTPTPTPLSNSLSSL
jgi:hypothetical protein